MIRLAVRVALAHAEEALAELLVLAPAGVEEIAHGDSTIEYAVYGAPGELPLLGDLQAAIGGALVEVSTSEIADDWAQRWREFHVPIKVDDRLWVRPPWFERAADGLIDIEIEPAQAFGTGAHATTHLCLGLLLALQREGAAQGSLLDIGCGSGVLAIAAAKLGWAPVLALDHEPQSVEATEDNARINGVEIDVARLDLRRDRLPTADTFVANLLLPLLLELAAKEIEFPQSLIASGLLIEQGDEVAAAFAPHGLIERERRERGEWIALLLQRTSL